MQISRNALRSGDVLGRVVGLWRYPVKSMAAESLLGIDASWHGFAGDRRWAFMRSGVEQSGFPWLTLRDRSDLSDYSPSFIESDKPDKSRTVVRTPSGKILDVTDPELAMELSPGARVVRQDRGIFDTFPLSLITTQTIDQLGAMTGYRLDVKRFRPNIVIAATDGTAFPEDAWVGSVLRMGGLLMRVDKRDGRCAVITIDPETTERNPEILRIVARERQGCLGVYGTTVEPGTVALDDAVVVA